MREIGVVQNIFGEYADVAIVRKTACGENCASCSGGCTPGEQIIRARNTAFAKKGDRVVLEMQTGKVVKAAFWVYILPIICLVAGTIIGQEFFGNEWTGILTGIGCMLVCFLVIHFLDARNKDNYEVVVTEILYKSRTGN